MIGKAVSYKTQEVTGGLVIDVFYLGYLLDSHIEM